MYIYIQLYECFFPNKHSFRSPGGVDRGLDTRSRAKICARELASIASRGPPVVSRGLQWPPVDNGTDCIYSSRVSDTTLGPKFEWPSVSAINPSFQTHTDISVQLPTYPGNIPSPVWARKRQLAKKQNSCIRSLCNIRTHTRLFPKMSKYICKYVHILICTLNFIEARK